MVIYIALAYRKLNDVTNCYIFNLAIMDLLFITFCIPFTIYMYTNSSWLFGVTFCKLNHFMSHASVQATCLTLTAMTIHRCNLIIQNKLLAQNAASTSKSRQTVLLVTSIIWLGMR
jgi:KISS1 receptor